MLMPIVEPVKDASPQPPQHRRLGWLVHLDLADLFEYLSTFKSPHYTITISLLLFHFEFLNYGEQLMRKVHLRLHTHTHPFRPHLIQLKPVDAFILIFLLPPTASASLARTTHKSFISFNMDIIPFSSSSSCCCSYSSALLRPSSPRRSRFSSPASN